MPKIKLPVTSYQLPVSKGFSLIELIIGIAIIVSVAWITIPGLKVFNTKAELDTYTENLKNTLKTAQSRASSSIKCSSLPSVNWIVVLNSTSYQIICNTSPNEVSGETITTTLPSNITIYSISGCASVNNTSLIFQGESLNIKCSDNTPVSSATITLKNSAGSQDKTISVSQGGVIGD